MFLKNSLNRHLNWIELLTCLGNAPQSQVLPAIADCPDCADKLEVYQDVAELGQWYRCRSCNFLGDGLELAMRVWQLSLDDTVERLLRSGFTFDPGESLPESLEHYAEFRIGRRKKAHDFWTQAKDTARLQSNPDAVGLQRRFSRDLVWTSEEWARRGGQVYGVVSRYEVETCWQPGNVAYRKAGGDGSKHFAGGGGDRIFSGPGWDHSLVIPYYDLPGRINGFVFLGRKFRPKIDWTYHPVLSLHHQARENRNGMEAGIGFLQVADRGPHSRYGNKLFVMDDPELALRLHMRHIPEHSYSLPLLATWDGPDYRTLGAWDHLPARPLLFAGRKFTPNLILQARHTGSPLALIPFDIDDRLGATRPETVLDWLEKHTVTWEQAVEHVLTTTPPLEALDFFRKLQLPDLDITRLLQAAPEETRKRLETLVIDKTQVRVIPHGQQKLEITPWCWRNHKTKELLTDAPYVIDQVLHRTNSGTTQYRGTISFRGTHYPFLAQADIFDAAPFRWIRDYLIRHGAGMPTFKERAAKDSIAIAQQIKTPNYLAVPDAVGWQSSAKGFVFPEFTVLANGQLLNSGSGAPATGFFPCRTSKPPRALTALEVESLSQDESQVKVFWATAAAVLTNVIAPVSQSALFNVALVGRVAQLAGRYAAERLGCVVLDPRTGRQHAGAIRDAQNLLDLHTWPVFLTRPPNEVNLTLPASVLGALPQPAFVSADALDAAICALDPSWVVFDTSERCSKPAAVPLGGDLVIATYLQSLARRRFQLNLDDDPLLAVLDDLADWFTQQEGDASVIHDARSLIQVGLRTAGAERFAHLLARAIDTGACFRQGDGEKYRRGQAVIARMNDGNYHIPFVTVRRITDNRGFPCPDARLICDALDTAGVQYSEAEIGGEPGWLVPADWLDRTMRRFRAQSRGYLKVVSE